jgi:hypothetical protein
MTDIYFVVARGVYEHGPLGLYTTLDEAKARCEHHAHITEPYRWGDRALRFNGDGWHSYIVYLATPDGTKHTFVTALAFDFPTKTYHWTDVYP